MHCKAWYFPTYDLIFILAETHIHTFLLYTYVLDVHIPLNSR